MSLSSFRRYSRLSVSADHLAHSDRLRTQPAHSVGKRLSNTSYANRLVIVFGAGTHIPLLLCAPGRRARPEQRHRVSSAPFRTCLTLGFNVRSPYIFRRGYLSGVFVLGLLIEERRSRWLLRQFNLVWN